MVAFTLSVIVSFIITYGIVAYIKRTPADSVPTWGEAMFGAMIVFFLMFWVRNDGKHDLWRAKISGTDSDYFFYRFEIRDGEDVDHYNTLGMWSDSPSHGDFLIDSASRKSL